MRVLFHIVAAIAVAFHVLAGGLITIVILNLAVDEFDPLAIVLKALAVVSYLAGVVLGAYAWSRYRWAVVLVPIITLGVPLAIVLAGNRLTDWYIPIGY